MEQKVATEITQVDPMLNIWTARLNGNGFDFDAVCTIRAVSNDTILICGVCAKTGAQPTQMFRDIRKYFQGTQYLHAKFVRNGVDRSLQINPC